MSFQFKASVSVAFNFDPAGDDNSQDNVQSEDITPSVVSQCSSQPQPASGTQHQTPCNPPKLKPDRFGRLQRSPSMPTSANDSTAETNSAKAKDRESLKLLIRATGRIGRSTKTTSGNEATSSGPTDASLVQQVPGAPSSITLKHPFVSDLPLNLPYDSGSDLVSSPQRLRVGSLASYFERLQRTAALNPPLASASLIREGVKGEVDDIVEENDEAQKTELDRSEEMSTGEGSDEGLTA